MYNKRHDLDNARRRLQNQLIRMGWTKHRCPYPVTDKIELRACYYSPHIHNSFFWFENCLKKINPVGEVYYALEMRCSKLEHLSWRCNQDNPNNHRPLDTLDAFEIARDYMLDGIPWDYGTGDEEERGIIKVIDWEHPENNTFEFVTRWRGAMNDGFGWDFILCVNAIPLGAILLEPNHKAAEGETQGTGNAPCQSALDLAQYQLDNDFQFPVYCHSLVISDGEKILMGDPWAELNDFKEIATLKEELRPVDFLINHIKHLE